MVRTQIQMTEEQMARLRQLSTIEHKSMAELIRQAVDSLVSSKGAIDTKERQRRAIVAAGRFHSGVTDLSKYHDKYLAEMLKK